MIANSIVSALVEVLVFGGIPFLIYALYQKWRNKRSFREIRERTGLQLGRAKYLVYGGAVSAVLVALLLAWMPPLELMGREGSAQHQFVGLGITSVSVVMALLYGGVQTGFTEELLFRGLIAGSLSRRLHMVWANTLQALIFLLPHLFIISVAPQLWMLLPFVFVVALIQGWLRIKSGSIISSWLVHASVNVTMALMVATSVTG